MLGSIKAANVACLAVFDTSTDTAYLGNQNPPEKSICGYMTLYVNIRAYAQYHWLGADGYTGVGGRVIACSTKSNVLFASFPRVLGCSFFGLCLFVQQLHKFKFKNRTITIISFSTQFVF